MSNYEMCMTDEEFIRYNSYLRKMSKINPKFILDKTFSVSDEDIEKGKSLINEIENLAKDIKKAKTPKERNAINREKGKKLEELAGVMFNSA
ncbi:MAG: hypothetical protein ACLRMQ_10805 [Clostridium perfringens]